MFQAVVLERLRLKLIKGGFKGPGVDINDSLFKFDNLDRSGLVDPVIFLGDDSKVVCLFDFAKDGTVGLVAECRVLERNLRLNLAP